MLFGNTDGFSVSNLAKRALEMKEAQQKSFDDRVKQYFAKLNTETDSQELQRLFQQKHIEVWPSNLICQLHEKYGSVLLGLFHFGPHRHIFLDLAAQRLPTIAPIAGKAYWDFYNLRHSAPAEFADSIQLLEVEKRKVGSSVFREIKKGRIGAIYVDGNMGPSSSIDDESHVEVEFFGKRINVKYGISRLQKLLKLPILPILSCEIGSELNGTSKKHIKFAEPILPMKEGEDKQEKITDIYSHQKTMQTLYNFLSEEVKKTPEHWEFALCFHRWLAKETETDLLKSENFKDVITGKKRIELNKNKVVAIGTLENMVWIDFTNGEGYKPPKCDPLLFHEISKANEYALSNIYDATNTEVLQSFIEQLWKKNLITIV